MRKATSFLLRFIRVPERTDSPDWWTYFGSFGNDIFGDEDMLMCSTSTPDEAAFRYRGVLAETTGAVDLQTSQIGAHETHSAVRSR